jgi:two-component system LytT family response regulator
MNCLIIDHDNNSRNQINQLACRIEDLHVSAEFANSLDAYHYLEVHRVDILFLEIDMPEINGLELARNLSDKEMVIIFMTAGKEYAAEAYELDRSDYLLKPFATERFLQAVSKAREIIMQQRKQGKISENNSLFIRDSNIIRQLKLEDILYAQALGDYVGFFTPDKLYAIHGKLKKAEERLPPSRFIRVHRSYIISLNKIDTMDERGVTINGRLLPVAGAYRGDLNKRMNIV